MNAFHALRRSRLSPLSACLAAAFATASPHETLAANLPVTSCLDDGGPGTLRSVMDAAVDGDVIDLTRLTCSTITLTSGVIDTSVFGYHPLDYLTVDGPGRGALTITANDMSEIFRTGGYELYGFFTINDLTLAHGGNQYGLPACLWSVHGTLVLNRVTVTECHAQTFPDAFAGAYRAGAVKADALTMMDSVITNSSFTAYYGENAAGGGIYVGGTAVLVGSTVSGNSVRSLVANSVFSGAPTAGGGIYSTGNLVVIDSTISGNTVEATNSGANGVGGGIFVRGSATIVGSTISGNMADGDGGGMHKPVEHNAVDHGTTLTIQNSTITGNSAGGVGGGLVSERPTWLANSTIAFNDGAAGGAVMFERSGGYPGAGWLDLQSTIIASNASGSSPPYATDLATDDVLTLSGANSLVMDAAAGIALPPDTLRSDPLLLPLAWNGGSMQTLALSPGSPAIDAGANPLGLDTDQRGGAYVRV